LQPHRSAKLPIEKELAYASAALQSAERLERQADLTSMCPSCRARLCSSAFPEALHDNVDHVVDNRQWLLTAQRHFGKAKRVAGHMT
jgi:hypothetical protein